MTMESREYRGSSSNSSVVGGDPFWLLLTAILILALVLVGLPAIIAAFWPVGVILTKRSVVPYN